MEETVSEIAKLLAETGVKLRIEKIHVDTEEKAKKVGFLASPTIRINGYDIQSDIKESTCESGVAVCGEDTECRVWTWRGKDYTAAPQGLIIEAILRAIYGEQKPFKKTEPLKKLPKNLVEFYAAKRRKEAFGF